MCSCYCFYHHIIEYSSIAWNTNNSSRRFAQELDSIWQLLYKYQDFQSQLVDGPTYLTSQQKERKLNLPCRHHVVQVWIEIHQSLIEEPKNDIIQASLLRIDQLEMLGIPNSLLLNEGTCIAKPLEMVSNKDLVNQFSTNCHLQETSLK